MQRSLYFYKLPSREALFNLKQLLSYNCITRAPLEFLELELVEKSNDLIFE